ncbi:MAG: SPFH domain-containing protein [Thermoplasmata archaeon]
MMDIWMLALIVVVLLLILFAIFAAMYTIVPADYVDVVIQKGKMRVLSPHREYNTVGKAAYFKIPSWFFLLGLGMTVHRVPLRMITIDVANFMSFDIDRARFLCNIITYVAVTEPVKAAQRFGGNIGELEMQVAQIVTATTRDACTKKTIREIINNREDIIETVTPSLRDAIQHWGIDLKDIELVDFKDPTKAEYGEEMPPHVIKDISSIIEEQINSEARQKNAEQRKIARLKEAETDEEARKREIRRDEEVAKREQEKDKAVAEQQKVAVAEQYEVVRVEEVKMAEIMKQKALVVANQNREVEEINKEQKRLDGEGDRIYLTEKAKGEASPIRERGLADAEAKMKLQDALNRFGPEAIRALVAEKLVDMQKEIGIETAKALSSADLKVFAGGSGARAGFDLGQMIESMSVASDSSAMSVLNRLARPNDLGFKDIMGVLTGVLDENKELKSKVSKMVEEEEQKPQEEKKERGK